MEKDYEDYDLDYSNSSASDCSLDEYTDRSNNEVDRDNGPEEYIAEYIHEPQKKVFHEPQREDDRGTLYHKFPGQGQFFTGDPHTEEKQEDEDEEEDDNFDPSLTQFYNNKPKDKEIPEMKVLIKERLDSLNRQVVGELERRLTRKPSEHHRQSVFSKIELVTVKGLIHSILNNRNDSYSPEHRLPTMNPSAIAPVKNAVAAKPILLKRFLKLRTHKSIDHSRKKNPLPITPPKPNPFRKANDQALDALLVLERLLIVKKELPNDDSKLDDTKIIYTKPPPTRKGPYYEEPFKAGTINTRFYKLLKRIDATVAKMENEDIEENEKMEQYIDQEFKALISSGGFYPSISYTPEITFVLKENEKVNPADHKTICTSKKSIPKISPNIYSSSNEKHILPAVSPYLRNDFKIRTSSKSGWKNTGNGRVKQSNVAIPTTLPALYCHKRKESTHLKSEGKNVMVVVGNDRVTQSNVANPTTLPALQKSKANNPIQSIITGMESHGKLKQAQFRIAFHRNYLAEFHLKNLPLDMKNKTLSQKE